MQKILGGMRKAIHQFNMIEDGDRVAVGVSGGKDSILLLDALYQYQKYINNSFDLLAIHIDMGFEETNMQEVAKFSDYIESRSIPFFIEKTNLKEILFDIRKESSPCSLCSKIRRGALNTIAKAHNCNKLALGHHMDDVLETFLLSLLYESRLNTFKPVSYLDRSDITVIRPFVYIDERNIIGATRNTPTITNPCPVNKETQREYMKNLIKKLSKDIPMAKEKIFSAITNPSRISLWDIDPKK